MPPNGRAINSALETVQDRAARVIFGFDSRPCVDHYIDTNHSAEMSAEPLPETMQSGRPTTINRQLATNGSSSPPLLQPSSRNIAPRQTALQRAGESTAGTTTSVEPVRIDDRIEQSQSSIGVLVNDGQTGPEVRVSDN